MSFLSRLREKAAQFLVPISSRSGGWWPTVREPFTGAWQRNQEINLDTVVNNPTVFACVTLISNDLGTLRNKLVEYLPDGRTEEVKNSPAFLPVLKKPNRYQNHIQFKEWWFMSKLLRGNAYALKQRDNRGIVVGLWLMDPCRTQILIDETGEIFYQFGADNLNGVEEGGFTVPASEVIHDRMNCLFHPMVGISPIFAAGILAGIELEIINNSASFFQNGSQPSGVILVPGPMNQDKADKVKAMWNSGTTGVNAGKVPMLTDGMTFQPLRMSAGDSQMLELLRWTDEKIAACFHVPAYKVGVGAMPAINNTNTLAQEYYNECLRPIIEEYEAVMDEGLGLDTAKDGRMLGVELDLTGLFRMDMKNQIDTLGTGVEKKIFTLNDARLQLNLPPLEGGDTVYMQQQDYPLDVIKDNVLPVVSQTEPVETVEEPTEPAEEDTPEEQTRALIEGLRKGFDLV